uniref:Queuosine 5'-phosphate N-glycosylase/hydrolase n=2 Tax=Macrostomum lignano TaxID=282301 RepID=A0A1I8GJ18_9PLAT
MSAGDREEPAMWPREAASWIVSQADHVTVLEAGIRSLADTLQPVFERGEYSLASWRRHPLNPKSADGRAVSWVFLADTLNFSFWSDAEADAKFCVTYAGERHTGYWSLCAAINRTLDEGFDLLDPKLWPGLTLDRLIHLLRGDRSEMPLMQERLDCLQETGRILVDRYGGDFNNVLLAAAGSARRLLELVVTEFPCYRDVSVYKGCRVGLYKRAQILVADIWGALEGAGPADFNDIDCLTAFADYRIPQALEYFGVLQYGPSLREALNERRMLPNGHPMEVEIRGATIHAVELLASEMRRRFSTSGNGHRLINSVLLDHYLWDYRRQFADKIDHLPFHRTRCIYY